MMTEQRTLRARTIVATAALCFAAPAVAQTDRIFAPPAGTFPYFPGSIFEEKIPAHPQIDERTSAWLEKTGARLGKFQFAADPSGLKSDYYTPVYVEHPGDPQLTRLQVHCTEPWGHCAAEGATVWLDPRASPEGGGDAHLAIVDPADRKEYDFWGTKWPPVEGKLSIAWGGVCSLDGAGYDGCTATATQTPLTLGVVRVADLFLALHTAHGTLPYALAVSTKWANGHTARVPAGDGHTDGYPPEGAKVFLDMSDAEVDAAPCSDIAKVILRTIDRDHYGMIITDQNGSQNEFGFATESDQTYTFAEKPGPLVTKLVPEAKAEGLPGTDPWNGVYYLQMPTPGIDFARKLKFLATGPIRT